MTDRNREGIEWQVSNLELSKKLKELGVKQESLFYWVKDERFKAGRLQLTSAKENDISNLQTF